jgi:hypothetical protein
MGTIFIGLWGTEFNFFRIFLSSNGKNQLVFEFKRLILNSNRKRRPIRSRYLASGRRRQWWSVPQSIPIGRYRSGRPQCGRYRLTQAAGTALARTSCHLNRPRRYRPDDGQYRPQANGTGCCWNQPKQADTQQCILSC